jgi:hypothetical protein
MYSVLLLISQSSLQKAKTMAFLEKYLARTRILIGVEVLEYV